MCTSGLLCVFCHLEEQSRTSLSIVLNPSEYSDGMFKSRVYMAKILIRVVLSLYRDDLFLISFVRTIATMTIFLYATEDAIKMRHSL